MKNMKVISITVLLFVFLTLIMTSFKNDKQNISIINEITKDTIKVKYHFDQTKYKLDKSGFYISENQDVFQLNTLTYDDTNGIWTTHYWLDSLLFYPNYPLKKPLKQFIDLNTFTSDTIANFEKDKNYVYFYRTSSDGVMRFVVKKADPKTFIGIKERWGKDNKNIYYETRIVKKADIETFKILTDSDSAKDKNYYYYQGERIK